MESSNGSVETTVQSDEVVQPNAEVTQDNAQQAASSKQDKPTKPNKRLTGTVKWFNVKDGFGFITRHDTGEDVFVHQSCILRPNANHRIRSVGDGEIVEFGLIASKVTGPGFKQVKGSAYVRPKSAGSNRGRPKSASSTRSSTRSKRGAATKKAEGSPTNNQTVGDGPLLKEMADLKVEDANGETGRTEVGESVAQPVASKEECAEEQPTNNDAENGDETESTASAASGNTMEAVE